jgi:hypothetical protein
LCEEAYDTQEDDLMGEGKAGPEQHRQFAVELNGRAWELLVQQDRSTQENEEMIHAAHASCYHWLRAGTGIHQQRGEWLISHVYAELGLGEAALRHAQRCRELTQEHAAEMADFDIAYSHEGLARAYAVAGDYGQAEQHLKLAKQAGQAIADKESKKIFLSDLCSGNWGGLKEPVLP